MSIRSPRNRCRALLRRFATGSRNYVAGTAGQPRPIGVPKGIRTPVTAVKGRCPRPLDDGDSRSDGRDVGGATRDRTADLFHAMEALSQLSYSPTEGSRRYARA